jgi:hypothetical protein
MGNDPVSIPVLKGGWEQPIAIVNGARTPRWHLVDVPDVQIAVVFDQSIFVKTALNLLGKRHRAVLTG